MDGLVPSGVGWLLGVFAPTLAATLGVVLFLRLPWIVAERGVFGALLVVALGSAIAGVTALSTSALATNMRVGPGGAYFLVSRSFGLEVGGAIGIPLFLSQALAVTWFGFALAEGLAVLWPDAPVVVVAALFVAGLFATAAQGLRVPPWGHMVALGAIAVAVGAFVTGIPFAGPQVPMLVHGEVGFWSAFAVFFPAMTGMLTGLSLSAELADPERDLSRGALWATAAGAAIYLVMPGILANAGDVEVLGSPGVWLRASSAPALVAVTVGAALLVAALGSVRAAPRTLQALAMDRLVPAAFADTGPRGEPRWGLGLTAVIALGGVLLGSFDAVALAVSALFLTTFGALNLVAGLEGLIGDTSFRPRVRVPWALSLAGTAACLGALLAISPIYAGIAMVAELGVLWTLSRRSLQATFGDARTGMLLSAARWTLLELRDARPDPRNWRPHLLVFTTDLHRTLPVVRWADAFGQHRGIVTVVHLHHGDAADDPVSLLRTDEAMLRTAGITAFCEVTAVPDLEVGAVIIAQANGTAGMQSNTAMFGYHPEHDGPDELAALLRIGRRLAAVEKCTTILVPSPRSPHGTPRFVVWWVGRQNHGDLMLLLAHLARSTREHRRARIELKSIAEDEASAREIQRDFDGMLPTVRIEVDVAVLVRGPEAVHDVIARESDGAILVFLGLPVPSDDAAGARAVQLDALVRRLPATVLVHNAGPFRGRLV